MGRCHGGGDHPLGSRDFGIGLRAEVGGPRLVRPEIGDLAEAVVVQQFRYLSTEEPADERLTQLRGDPGHRTGDLSVATGQGGRWLVVSQHDAGTGTTL